MYGELIKYVKDAGVLASVGELLGWDYEVTMPRGASSLREMEMSLVASLRHKMLTDPRIGELLAKIDAGSLSEPEQANVREIRRNYDRALRIPVSLVEKSASLSIRAHEAWQKARATNDFPLFLPFLEQFVEIKRAMALAIGGKEEPYQTLLSEYEPDIRLAELEVFFKEIERSIVPLVEAIAKREVPDTGILKRHVGISKQMKYNRGLAQRLGYDFKKGRLDTAVHPFTGCFGRITTRFTDGWAGTISSTVHESGHGMYEHNLPEEHFGTPLGSYRSLGVHESQSRLWENHVGKSLAFWRGEYPRLRKAYAPILDDLSPEAFYRLINVVAPGFIRVNADELTYSLHIALRFEIEKALVCGSLRAKDVPEAWNEGMRRSLGIVPPSDALGCLQDSHWTDGSFGYFPTYTYGSAIAAQLMEAATRSIPSLENEIGSVEVAELNVWLKENIHRHGCRYSTEELVTRATGDVPNPRAYIDYLNRKFRALYSV